MAELLKGAPVVAAMNEKASADVLALKEKGVHATLAIVRVGEKPDDIAYEQGATKRCEKVGVGVRHVTLPQDATQATLQEALRKLNSDSGVHGVLLLRPLPAQMNDNEVCNTLAPEKDIDGITDASLAGVFAGIETGYPPCTAQACMEILEYYGVDPKGKRATVVGRSLVVGKPLSMMLLQKHATVTICHTRTVDLPSVCREAEILTISAGRKARGFTAEYFSPGQVVLDVGIYVDENGKMCGDVDFEAAETMVGSVTPVPGGVGTVTTSVLVKHVVEAAQKQTQ
ncbi:bifunctional 5,10-methylenetetrahydrofolate dehydrogenase/5,10-methenyltetrahydrofolate cyclohydrolase [Ruminococcaceae bacterium OttesenSCG-928-I18]|nr:bifunctional 5,10-methylenetetrahydrofolate dehydrogenase/5,10-methenyltetrahydrofolate cyclohydrolase [Ruminococcaceae bacterium OttesenSCG-928-I18]